MEIGVLTFCMISEKTYWTENYEINCISKFDQLPSSIKGFHNFTTINKKTQI